MRSRRLVIVIISGLITTNAILGNLVANVLQERLGKYGQYNEWVIALFVLITIILLLFEIRSAHHQSQQASTEVQDSRNRSAMLKKVRTMWISDVLKKSLYNEILISLDLAERPDAVFHPLDLLVQRPGYTNEVLPANTRVIDVFDNVSGELLISGSPGAGKTTLLLTLVQDLLDRAEKDSAHPIPVVFPLSSWTQLRAPISDWLKDELQKRYDVPQHVAHKWIDADHILPLLDGLDEMQREYQEACVEAINAFRQTHGLLSLVVTSRTQEYESLTQKLRLHGAISVLPLTRQHVDDYLAKAGKPLEAVRELLRSNNTLWELLETPLMLNVITFAYSGLPVSAIEKYGTIEEQRQQLFRQYVTRMFKRRTIPTRYTPEQTIHWLSWLARQMVEHGQTVFYIERLQPTWLPRSQQWQVTIGSGLLLPLLIELGCGLGSMRIEAFYSPTKLFEDFDWGALYGYFVAIVVGILLDFVRNFRTGLIYGFLSGLGPSVGALISGHRGAFFGFSLFGSVTLGVVAGLISKLHRKTSEVKNASQNNDPPRYLWTAVRANFWSSLRTSFCFGLPAGVAYGVIAWFKLDFLSGVIWFFMSGPLFTLTAAIVFVSLSGWVTTNFDTASSLVSKENEVIWRVATVALSFGVILGTAVYELGDATATMGTLWAASMLYGLWFGLIFGIITALRNTFSSTIPDIIKSVEVIRWSWSSVRSSIFPSLKAGLIPGLLIFPLAAATGDLRLAGALGVGTILAFWLVATMIGGWSNSDIEEKVVPNQGMKRSAWNAIRFGVVASLGSYLLLVASDWLLDGTIRRVGYLEPFAISFGLMTAIQNGGFSCLQHLLLRFSLTRNGSAPWNYPAFLDYAAERIFLRRVGGGYMFIHRMLMEHFATQNTRSDYVSPKIRGTMTAAAE